MMLVLAGCTGGAATAPGHRATPGPSPLGSVATLTATEPTGTTGTTDATGTTGTTDATGITGTTETDATDATGATGATSTADTTNAAGTTSTSDTTNAANTTDITGTAGALDSAAASATPPDIAAIKSTIAAINATAGGPVATQRALLQRMVAPGQAAAQRACPTAHSTLSFEPAYRDLRRMPASFITAATTNPPVADATADGGPDSGGGASISSAATTPTSRPQAPGGPRATAYLLPAFITIYTGDRITGTDLTTLRLWVSAGSARIAALCIS